MSGAALKVRRRRFLAGGGAIGLGAIGLGAISLGLCAGGLRGAQAATPRRIVCSGGAMTEIVFALGAGAEVVAVDTTSVYPWAATEKLTKIGYLRQLSAEGILSTKPDIILADVDSGPADVLELLKAAGAPLAHFKSEHSANSVAPKIHFVGKAIDRAAEAEALATAFTADLETIDDAVAKLAEKPSVLFVLSVGTNGLRGAGQGTAAAEMIDRAGGKNCFDTVTGYKPISAEAGLAADPDYIVMMTQSLQELGGLDAVAGLPALTRLNAAKERRIVALDATFLLSFGPRTAHAARDLAAAIHPGADLPVLPARAWTAA